jgi:hypothetical protein
VGITWKATSTRDVRLLAAAEPTAAGKAGEVRMTHQARVAAAFGRAERH